MKWHSFLATVELRVLNQSTSNGTFSFQPYKAVSFSLTHYYCLNHVFPETHCPYKCSYLITHYYFLLPCIFPKVSLCLLCFTLDRFFSLYDFITSLINHQKYILLQFKDNLRSLVVTQIAFTVVALYRAWVQLSPLPTGLHTHWA